MAEKRTIAVKVLSIALAVAGAIILLVLGSGYFFVQESREPIVIEYWTHSDPARDLLEERLINEFEAQYPHISIERRIYSSAELLNALPTALSAGLGPDMFNLQQDYLGTIINDGSVAKVNYQAAGFESLEEMQTLYMEESFDGATYNGAIYGIPMEYTNWCLYINKELFEETGLDPESYYPRTWEDVVRISELLVEREDGILVKRGFDFRYPHYLTFFVPMVEQLGGGLYSDDGKLSITGLDAWETAFRFMQDWGPLGRNLGSPTYENARTVYNDGEIAMMLSGLYHVERLRRIEPEFFTSGEWMVVPFPVFEGGEKVSAAKYTHYWCVNNDISASKQEASWLFIGFLSEHAEDYLKEVCLLQPRLSVIENLDDYDIPYADVFISDLEHSSFVYSGPESIALKTNLDLIIKEVMLSGLDPQKAVIKLKVIVEELSESYSMESLY